LDNIPLTTTSATGAPELNDPLVPLGLDAHLVDVGDSVDKMRLLSADDAML